MSSYFRFSRQTDENGKDHFFGSPNRGGLCYRVCRSRWRGTCSLGNFEGKLGNMFYMSVDQIPCYVEMGIDVLKVQGREYSTELIREMIGFYRDYIDALYLDPNQAQNPVWHQRSRELARMRDQERGRRTGALLDECTAPGTGHLCPERQPGAFLLRPRGSVGPLNK